jgi:molybdopterin molybdotransferase
MPYMISVEEARERILALVPLLETEDVPILQALGQVTAQDVVASLDIPPLDNTAMDGYAVRAEDTASASESSPATLRVVGELAAGYVFDRAVGAGEAVRIMTGAPMPAGADAVVPFEETDEVEGDDGPEDHAGSLRDTGRAFGSFAKSRAAVAVLKPAEHSANIRPAGQDVRRGQLVIPRGTILQPPQVGVLASLGMTTVRVHRRPIVAVLSTGDEVIDPGARLGPGQIYDSNAYGISAMILAAGGLPRRLGIARDTVDSLTARIHNGLDADLLVTSAGVSRGDYDIVKDVLAKEGEIDFWTVRMRPGKPLAFGSFPSGGRRVPHLGLPGNPVSAMVSFELFGRPAIYKMLGRTDWQRSSIRAIADEAITNEDARRVYARVILSNRDGVWHASLTGPQGSGILTSMAAANALAVVPEDVGAVAPGESVECLLLD